MTDRTLNNMRHILNQLDDNQITKIQAISNLYKAALYDREHLTKADAIDLIEWVHNKITDTMVFRDIDAEEASAFLNEWMKQKNG